MNIDEAAQLQETMCCKACDTSDMDTLMVKYHHVIFNQLPW